mmetsp:Transcript_3671/g.11459  ORF Transcript_3671/g.11459 Transcript_3671/m.11459 type:complete len:281 (-) Transcript_3671:421-1263(-)
MATRRQATTSTRAATSPPPPPPPRAICQPRFRRARRPTRAAPSPPRAPRRCTRATPSIRDERRRRCCGDPGACPSKTATAALSCPPAPAAANRGYRAASQYDAALTCRPLHVEPPRLGTHARQACCFPSVRTCRRCRRTWAAPWRARAYPAPADYPCQGCRARSWSASGAACLSPRWWARSPRQSWQKGRPIRRLTRAVTKLRADCCCRSSRLPCLWGVAAASTSGAAAVSASRAKISCRRAFSAPLPRPPLRLCPPRAPPRPSYRQANCAARCSTACAR